MITITQPETLEETVDLMSSEDYKDRFRAEYYQVEIRYKKLSELITKYDQGKLDFEPDCSIETLRDQLHIMMCYLIVLETRAKVEKIEL